jgi:hypothetical protein
MYETKAQSLKSFVEDTSIKLPRFQRKLTWNRKKNFFLAVSVIKNYPLGVTILRVEQDVKSKLTTKWLLDGRQRRNALQQMLTDPVQIYEWAKVALGIKGNDNTASIQDKFRKKIEEYIEIEPYSEEEKNFNSDQESTIVDDESVEVDSTFSEETLESEPIKDLEFLLGIVILAHNGKKGIHSGITRPFSKLADFTHKTLNYYDNERDINPKKLRDFIANYKKFCDYEVLDYSIKHNFKTFFKKETQFKEEKKASFDVLIDQIWEQEILEVINVYNKLNDIFSNASIGTIEIREIKDHDAQKIFNLINTGGTKLTAAEILAARPIWNKEIKNVSPELNEEKNKLYKEKSMLVPDGVTYWDAAATFLMRLKNSSMFFNDDNFEGESGIAKKITISFKLLSAIVTKGIKKEDIDEQLSVNTDWIIKIDELINDLNMLFKLIKESQYFATLNTWGKSVSSLLGDSPTINFIALTYLDWVKKGKPISNTNANKVKKNAFVLIDKLFYEFLNKQWRGSSDSKVNRNLLTYQPNDDINPHVESEKWKSFLHSMFFNFKIGGEDLTFTESSKLIYHYYSIKGIKGPNDTQVRVEVDHIYSQSLLEESTIPNKKIIKDSPFNLSLLPKNKNISKSNRKLSEVVGNIELVKTIETYAEITEDRFQFYSNLNNWESLQKERYEKFVDAFEKIRLNILNS